MKKNFYKIILALLCGAALTACHAGHHHEGEDHDHDEAEHAEAGADAHTHGADDIRFSAADARAAGIRVETVRPGAFNEVIEVSGRITAAPGTEATLSATMAGIVQFADRDLTEGSAVRKGQSLFVVNAAEMANGNPAAAAASERTAAEQAYERAERLAKEKIISQRELEAARLRLEQARAAAESLGSAAQRRTLSAPLSGFVKALLVRPGDYVEAGAPLAVVSQGGRVSLRAEVPERYYRCLSHITSANFRMAYGGRSEVVSLKALNGRLVAKGQVASETDYFVPVTFEFDGDGRFVSGCFADVYLLSGERQGVISVPNEALTEAQGLYFVYVRTSAEEYRRQEVRLGHTDGLRTEITEGLKAGDEVVTEGATYVRLAANTGAVPEGHSHNH